jgi:hypothetical protein
MTGTCFGYSVVSSLPFRYLRGGTGTPLEVVEAVEDGVGAPPVMEWREHVDQPFHARLHRDGRRYLMWIHDTGWYSIDPDERRITIPPTDKTVLREERLWSIPTLLCVGDRGDVGLHGAAVEIAGGAVVIAAPGRCGKTTLAGAFLQRGYRVLAEDIACCRPGDPPVLFPGPAMLRMRRDSYESLGFDGVSVVADEPHRVHLAIDPAARGSGEPLPLTDIVFLRARTDGYDVEPVPFERALPDLMTLAFAMPTDADRARSFKAVAALAGSVRLWNFVRPMEYQEIDKVIDRIVAQVEDGR